MKKVLFLTIIASLVIVSSVFATQFWDRFENGANDLNGFGTWWNASPGIGPGALTICSTDSHTGAACMQYTLTADTTSTKNQAIVAYSSLSQITQGSADTIFICWVKIKQGIGWMGVWQYAQNSAWSWEPQGSYPGQSGSSWSAYTEFLIGGGVPYQQVGFQLDLDDGVNLVTPPLILLLDDWSVGPTVLDVKDWSLMASQKME